MTLPSSIRLGMGYFSGTGDLYYCYLRLLINSDLSVQSNENFRPSCTVKTIAPRLPDSIFDRWINLT